jgi:hypothetical protein
MVMASLPSAAGPAHVGLALVAKRNVDLKVVLVDSVPRERGEPPSNVRLSELEKRFCMASQWQASPRSPVELDRIYN